MLTVTNLTKTYGSKQQGGCTNVAFSVQGGEVVSVLGVNGAGKSSLFNTIAMYYPPSSGDAFIAGHSITHEAIYAKQHLGVLFEQNPLYSDMTIYGFLLFSAEMYGLKRAAAKRQVEKVLSLLNLEDAARKNIAVLSKGFKQRVGLARAIVHNPAVVLLDEPVSALDAVQIHQFKKIVSSISKNAALVIATHNLNLAAQICTRHILMHGGRIIAQGTIHELSQRFDGAVHSDVAVLEQAFYFFAGVHNDVFHNDVFNEDRL